MNRECKNPNCPHGGQIIMMCQVGTDYCSQFCEETMASQPDGKPPVKKRSPRKTAKKAGAK